MAKQFPFEEDFVLGMKSSWNPEHIKARLDAIPELKLIELFIGKGELETNRADINRMIKDIGQQGIYVMLHEPVFYKGHRVNAAALNSRQQSASRECHQVLEDFCQENENAVGFVVHGHNPRLPDTIGYAISYFSQQRKQALLEHVKDGSKLRYEYLFIENVPRKIFAKPGEITGVGFSSLDSEGNGPGICIDIPALAMTYRHKRQPIVPVVQEIITLYSSLDLPIYFHIADSRRYTDALEIGKGDLPIEMMLPHIKVGIIEVRPQNETNPIEAIRSYKAVIGLRKRMVDLV